MADMNRYSVVSTNGKQYYLNTTVTRLKSERDQRIFFFTRDPRAATACALPVGYVVGEAKNGLPFVKKA